MLSSLFVGVFLQRHLQLSCTHDTIVSSYMFVSHDDVACHAYLTCLHILSDYFAHRRC